MELFDKDNNRKYSPEILIDAYENIEWTNGEGEFTFPDGDFFMSSLIQQKSRKKPLIVL